MLQECFLDRVRSLVEGSRSCWLVAMLACLLMVSQTANANCRRVQPDEFRLLVRASDAAGVTAALKCRRELLADETVRGALTYAFSKDVFPANEPFVSALRRSGLRFVADLAPLAPERNGDNMATPLGLAFAQGHREAIEWLLRDVKPGDLRAYRRLAFLVVDSVADRAELDEVGQARRAGLQAAMGRGLPVDSSNNEAYFRALQVWWRTQDLIDYRDSSFQSRFATVPLPASAAPLWTELSDLVAPADPGARTAVQLRAAEAYVKRTMDQLDAKVDSFKGTLAGATRVPGALVVDSMGMLSTSPGGRVPREYVEETIKKMEARRERLRTTLALQVGAAALPDWAKPPGQAGTFGEFLGLRLGARYSELVSGGEPPACGSEPATTFCARPALPALAWAGDPKLTMALNAAGRFPAGGVRGAALQPGTGDAGNGIVRLEVPQAARKHGLPTTVDVVVRQGRIEALLVQGGEQSIARELRRLWGDPASAYTEWFRVRDGQFYNRVVGTVELNSGETATLIERARSADDDRPVSSYRWQGEGGTAEMRCEMGCQLAILASPRAMTTSVTSPGPAISPPARELPMQLPADSIPTWQTALALLPKPPSPPRGSIPCDPDPLVLDPEALPARFPMQDTARVESFRRVVGQQMSLWARLHARFDGPEGCVHKETAIRMWQAAAEVPVTGQLGRREVAVFMSEASRARGRVAGR